MHLTPHATHADKGDELNSTWMLAPIEIVHATSCKTVISILALELRTGRYRIWAVGANRQCVRPAVLRCEVTRPCWPTFSKRIVRSGVVEYTLHDSGWMWAISQYNYHSLCTLRGFNIHDKVIPLYIQGILFTIHFFQSINRITLERVTCSTLDTAPLRC